LSHRKIRVGVFSSYFPTYRDAVFARLSQNAELEFNFLAGSPARKSYIRDAQTRPYPFHPIRKFAIPIPGTPNSISYRCGPVWALVRHKYDMLILSNDILALDTWVCCLLGRIVRTPVCIWGQGMSRPASKVRDSLRWLLTRLSSAGLYYSEGGRQYWIDRNIPSQKLFVAYNALDTIKQIQVREATTQANIAEFLRSKGIDGKMLVVYLGRLISIKKPSIFIDAVARAHAQDSRVVGILVGDGPQRQQLERQAYDYGLLGNTILFTGESYDENILARYIIASTVVMLPADAGLAIQHAAVYGAPIILGDVPNHHAPEQEIIEEGITGLWCSDENIDAFASAILRLVSDPAYRHSLSVNISKEIDEKYNVTVILGYWNIEN
jgi:glycosyltransferase involved in cell wall biosynthesis